MTATHVHGARFEIPTAHCGSCRAEIERLATSVPGVARAVMTLRTRTLTVTFEEPDVDANVIELALDTAGYPAHLIESWESQGRRR